MTKSDTNLVVLCRRSCTPTHGSISTLDSRRPRRARCLTPCSTEKMQGVQGMGPMHRKVQGLRRSEKTRDGSAREREGYVVSNETENKPEVQYVSHDAPAAHAETCAHNQRIGRYLQWRQAQPPALGLLSAQRGQWRRSWEEGEDAGAAPASKRKKKCCAEPVMSYPSTPGQQRKGSPSEGFPLPGPHESPG